MFSFQPLTSNHPLILESWILDKCYSIQRVKSLKGGVRACFHVALWRGNEKKIKEQKIKGKKILKGRKPQWKGHVKGKEQNKPAWKWSPGVLRRQDHTITALPRKSQCVRLKPGRPECDPSAAPDPFPLSRSPKSLTCVDKEQNQLWKQDPWTPEQPPCVHPSR